MIILALLVLVCLLAVIVYFSFKIYTLRSKSVPKVVINLTSFTDKVLPKTGFSSPKPVAGASNSVPSRCNVYRFLEADPSYDADVLLGDYNQMENSYTLPSGISISSATETSCLSVNELSARYVTSECLGISGASGITSDCYDTVTGLTYAIGTTINFFEPCQPDGLKLDSCSGDLVFIREELTGKCLDYTFAGSTGHAPVSLKVCDEVPSQLFIMNRAAQVVEGQPVPKKFGTYASFNPVTAPGGGGQYCLSTDTATIGGKMWVNNCDEAIRGATSNLGYVWNLSEFSKSGVETMYLTTDANNAGPGGFVLNTDLVIYETFSDFSNGVSTDLAMNLSIIPYALQHKYTTGGPILIPRL